MLQSYELSKYLSKLLFMKRSLVNIINIKNGAYYIFFVKY